MLEHVHRHELPNRLGRVAPEASIQPARKACDDGTRRLLLFQSSSPNGHGAHADLVGALRILSVRKPQPVTERPPHNARLLIGVPLHDGRLHPLPEPHNLFVRQELGWHLALAGRGHILHCSAKLRRELLLAEGYVALPLYRVRDKRNGSGLGGVGKLGDLRIRALV